MALTPTSLYRDGDAKLIIACHDELVVECPEEQAEKVARFVEEVPVSEMDNVLNPGLDANYPTGSPWR